jgi:ATP synthase I chain
MMNEHEHLDGSADLQPPAAEMGQAPSLPIDDRTMYERIVPRLLRNMLVASILLLGPAFWFYRWAGAIGFAFGAVVSYVNFRSLTRGVEALTERVVDHGSREKGGRIVLRFVVRYGLVGAAAYAIFKGSTLAFRGFLWGLCVPVAALMAEAVWEGYTEFRRET